MNYKYSTIGVCSRSIEFEIDDKGILRNVKFNGGCNGNTSGISALAEGQDARQVMKCLSGIKCGMKDTSCPDNLARAIDDALKNRE